MARLLVLSILLGAFSIQNAVSQAVYDLHLDNLLSMQQGLGWPHSLKVARGHEALMRLRRVLESPQTCTVTTPLGVTINVDSPSDSRYESWGDSCGVRVRNVVAGDEGRWRITTTSGNSSLTGWIELHVEDAKTTYTAPLISLPDGQTHTSVQLSDLDNLYCMVAQPFTEGSLVSGHCAVTLDRTTRAVQGNWNVLLGIPGKVNELHVQRRVAVEAERLDVGYIRDASTNKINLYCNILHTAKNITFCRFQKTTAESGFNIMDGLSDGQHSYYGRGFDQRECGMTIEQPTAQDYGTWRCSVGVRMWVGNAVQPQTPLQALISVAPDTSRSQREASVKSEDAVTRTVFTEVNMQFTVMCRADRSLRYCWFQHPNGTQYTPLPLSDENQQFWYAGENFQAGDCGITFSHATEEDTGVWTCHMGPSDEVGLEVTDRLNVRVTGPLAANEKEVETRIGETATLYCHTSSGIRTLDYCRFIAPNNVGLSVDETVTEEKAILGRYYFTPGRQLDYGHCSLTISSVQYEDLGVWTCAALVNEDTVEARDDMTLYVSGQSIPVRALSQAGIAGMVIGLAALFVALCGVVWYKRHSLFTSKRSPSSIDQSTVFHRSTTFSNVSSENSVSELEVYIREMPTTSISPRNEQVGCNIES